MKRAAIIAAFSLVAAVWLFWIGYQPEEQALTTTIVPASATTDPFPN